MVLEDHFRFTKGHPVVRKEKELDLSVRESGVSSQRSTVLLALSITQNLHIAQAMILGAFFVSYKVCNPVLYSWYSIPFQTSGTDV